MTATKEEFEKNLATGERFERIFATELRKIGADPIFSNGLKEWDIMAEGIKFEIKTDKHTEATNNIVVMTWTNKRLNHPGWIKYTTSDVLIYFINESEYYWIDMRYLKEFIYDTKGLFNERQISKNLDIYCYLIPINDITHTRKIIT